MKKGQNTPDRREKKGKKEMTKAFFEEEGKRKKRGKRPRCNLAEGKGAKKMDV